MNSRYTWFWIGLILGVVLLLAIWLFLVDRLLPFMNHDLQFFQIRK